MKSIEVAKASLESLDIPLTGEMNLKGLHAIFIRDPDRNVIELDEYEGQEPDTRSKTESVSSGAYNDHP